MEARKAIPPQSTLFPLRRGKDDAKRPVAGRKAVRRAPTFVMRHGIQEAEHEEGVVIIVRAV